MCANFRRTQRRYFIQIRLIVGMCQIMINSCTKFLDQSIYRRSLNCNLKVTEIHEIVEFWPFKRFSSNLGVASTYAKFININTKLFYYTIKPITNTNELHSLRHEAYF